MKRTTLVTGIILCIAATGCAKDGSSDGPEPTASTVTTTAPQIAVSVEPAPTQSNQGRNEITFDPCFGVGDSIVSAAGFDPKTREREDFVFDTYSFIGCGFRYKEMQGGQHVTLRTLTLMSSNLKLDDYRRKYEDTTTISIDGREAVRYVNPAGHRDTCNIAIQTVDGVLDITKTVSSPFTTEQPCDRIQEIAETIASALPK